MSVKALVLGLVVVALAPLVACGGRELGGCSTSGSNASSGTDGGTDGGSNGGSDGGRAGSCADFSGTWQVDGSCGPDTCIVTQDAHCGTSIVCDSGVATYTGTVSGNQFTFSGTTPQGTPGSCRGTTDGSTLQANCTVAIGTCQLSGVKQ